MAGAPQWHITLALLVYVGAQAWRHAEAENAVVNRSRLRYAESMYAQRSVTTTPANPGDRLLR